MSEDPLHQLLTPKALGAVALAAFGLGADSIMLAGGDLIWVGLVSALLLSSYILWLYASDLPGSIRHNEPPQARLLVPASMLAIVLITGFVIFKQKVLDGIYLAQVLDGVVIPLWNTVLSIMLDPETWFVLILVSGILVSRAIKSRTAPPSPDYGPEFDKAIAQLRAQIESDKERNSAKPTAPVNWAAWNHIDPLTIREACLLWAGFEPTKTVGLPGESYTRFRLVQQSVRSGLIVPEASGNISEELRRKLPLLYKRGAVQAEGGDKIYRDELKKLTDSIGEKPEFLYGQPI